jgi:hypothetical protein
MHRVDPDAPTIEAVADGGTDGASTSWNEIQKLIIPVNFRGGFIIRNATASTRTKRLDNADNSTTIGEALTALMGDTVTVTDSETPGVAFIEFNGDTLAGKDQPLLSIEVVDAPPGDVTISIPLDQPAMRARMRPLKDLANVPFELAFDFVASQAAESDPDAPAQREKSSGLKVNLTREVAWNDLDIIPEIEWTRPPKDRTLLHWSADQVATGVQHYIRAIGDGAALSIDIAHNLGTQNLLPTSVVEQATGKEFQQVYTSPGSGQFSVTILDDNSVRITFGSAPATNAMRATISAAIPVAQWAGHTHDTAQISRDGEALNDILDSLGSRVANLESLYPSTKPGLVTQASGIANMLPMLQEVLFLDGSNSTVFNAITKVKVARGKVDDVTSSEVFVEQSGIDESQLGSPAPYLLPAIHNNSPVNVTALPTPTAGGLWKNNGSTNLVLKGGGMLIGADKIIRPNEYIGSDGRILYKVVRYGTTNSYYPVAFERELWRDFIDDTMLAVGRTLDGQFGLALQLFRATSNAHWLLVIEKGTAPQDTVPATTGSNLQNIVWDTTTPLLSQRLILTPLLVTRTFGVRIKNDSSGITADYMKNGVWTGNNAAAPASANFALRARLINFDTENDKAADARGWVTYQVTGPGGLDADTGNTTDKPKIVFN